MSLYDAYAAADSALGWKSEVAARVRDFLERKVAPVGQSVESAVQGIERAVENTFSLSNLRSSLKSLRHWAGRRPHTDPTVDDELEILCQRVFEHKDNGIEDYATHLFSVDMKF